MNLGEELDIRILVMHRKFLRFFIHNLYQNILANNPGHIFLIFPNPHPTLWQAQASVQSPYWGRILFVWGRKIMTFSGILIKLSFADTVQATCKNIFKTNSRRLALPEEAFAPCPPWNLLDRIECIYWSTGKNLDTVQVWKSVWSDTDTGWSSVNVKNLDLQGVWGEKFVKKWREKKPKLLEIAWNGENIDRKWFLKLLTNILFGLFHTPSEPPVVSIGATTRAYSEGKVQVYKAPDIQWILLSKFQGGGPMNISFTLIHMHI